MKCDEKLVRLEETYGDWVKQEKENCRMSSGEMTKELYPYQALFSPIQVNKTMIKNRVVMGPMGNLNMCEESGRPNDKMLQYFFARAKGGTGLLTTGLIPVSHGIDPTVTEVDDLSLFPRIDHARTVFAGWRDLAQGVHAYGSKIFIQITPGLGRVGPPTCVMTKHKIPVSASVNPSFYIPQLPCIPLTDANLKKIVKNCGQAAADAKEMGLDGIYLHGHEGYLLEQMTNPAFNRRQMGRYKDYEMFGLDIIREIRKRAGDSFPIMYRIDLSLALNETYQERMNEVSSLKRFKMEERLRIPCIIWRNWSVPEWICLMWIWAAMTTGGCRIHRRECRRDVSLICPRSQKNSSAEIVSNRIPEWTFRLLQSENWGIRISQKKRSGMVTATW